MSTDTCLDSEILAALVERRVTGSRERRSMLAHIASCEDCYVAFAGTARLIESGSAHRLGPKAEARVVSLLRLGAAAFGRAPWLLPTAAALILAIGLWWRGASEPPRPGPTAKPAVARTTTTPAVPTPMTETVRRAPAWLRDAPWVSAGRARYGFASEPAPKRALLVGMQLAALGRACQGTGTTADLDAVQEVGQSLRNTGLMADGERDRLLSKAAAHDCAFAPPGIPTTRNELAQWREMGRMLEQWRIAAVERDPSAKDAARVRQLGALLAVLSLDGPAARVATRLADPARASADRAWDSLAEDLTELLELLCA